MWIIGQVDVDRMDIPYRAQADQGRGINTEAGHGCIQTNGLAIVRGVSFSALELSTPQVPKSGAVVAI